MRPLENEQKKRIEFPNRNESETLSFLPSIFIRLRFLCVFFSFILHFFLLLFPPFFFRLLAQWEYEILGSRIHRRGMPGSSREEREFKAPKITDVAPGASIKSPNRPVHTRGARFSHRKTRFAKHGPEYSTVSGYSAIWKIDSRRFLTVFQRWIYQRYIHNNRHYRSNYCH